MHKSPDLNCVEHNCPFSESSLAVNVQVQTVLCASVHFQCPLQMQTSDCVIYTRFVSVPFLDTIGPKKKKKKNITGHLPQLFLWFSFSIFPIFRTLSKKKTLSWGTKPPDFSSKFITTDASPWFRWWCGSLFAMPEKKNPSLFRIIAGDLISSQDV